MKSKCFILIGLVFAVLLVSSAVADQKTTSKEEKKVNANPKAQEAASKETKNVEEVEVAEPNWGGGGGGWGGGGWGGGRRCCGRNGIDDVEAAETNFRRGPSFGPRRGPFRGPFRGPRRGPFRGPRHGGWRGGGGAAPAEEADENYQGFDNVEAAEPNYGGGGWGGGGRGGGGGWGGGGRGGGGWGGGGHGWAAEP